jgi:hypothetical protein
MKSHSSKAYELMVKVLLEAELKEQGLAGLQAYHLKKYLGKSGQEHEIDVSFEVTLGKICLLFLVECKDHNRKVGVEDILSFSYRLRDVGAHKGLIVTTSGFQKGVHTVAKAERIGLIIAIKGRIVSYWGYLTGQMDYVQYGMTCFVISLSAEQQDMQFIGRRYVTVNTELEAVRLTSDSAPKGIMFITHEEEFLVERAHAETERRILKPRAKSGWGHQLPSGSITREHSKRQIYGEDVVIA